MISEQLFEAVGQLDEQWIAEAAQPVHDHHQPPYP